MADSQVITQHWLAARRERPTTAHIYTHKNTYLHSPRTQLRTTPPAHTHTNTNILLLLLTCTRTYAHSQIQRLHYVKQDYNDSNLTGLGSRCASGARVSEFTVEVKDCPQFKQVCTYADAQLKHVVCISCCSRDEASLPWSRSHPNISFGVSDLFPFITVNLGSGHNEWISRHQQHHMLTSSNIWKLQVNYFLFLWFIVDKLWLRIEKEKIAVCSTPTFKLLSILFYSIPLINKLTVWTWRRTQVVASKVNGE